MRHVSLAFLSLTKLLRDALARDERSRCAFATLSVRVDDAACGALAMRNAEGTFAGAFGALPNERTIVDS